MPVNSSKDRSIVSMAAVDDRSMSVPSIESAIMDALEPLGSIPSFVKPGQIVALKPNQTLWKLATDGSTTSPRMIAALTHMCKEAGAKDVWVVEAAGHAQLTRNVCAITGMADAVKAAGAHMIYLDEIAHKVVDFGRGAKIRYMTVPEVLDRVDVIIDCPKAKTHFYDPVSCACKNWIGLIPMSLRLTFQHEGDPYYWANSQMLSKYRPALTVCDGMIAGSGQGPGSNKPFWWGYILASTDPVAMDVMVARLFSLDWTKIRMAREAADLGVGVFDAERIDLAGVPFDTARVEVQPAEPGVHRYPCRVIEGKGATMEGTLGHWKTIADAWLDTGLWTLFTSRGTPTFMFGEVEDPDFEEHVKEGPYVVLGDSALDKYKYDPRVTYVPGNPVPQSYIQHEMVEGMGFGELYQPGLRLYETGKQFLGRLRGDAGTRARMAAIGGGIAALAAAGVAVPMILRGRASGREERKAA